MAECVRARSLRCGCGAQSFDPLFTRQLPSKVNPRGFSPLLWVPSIADKDTDPRLRNPHDPRLLQEVLDTRELRSRRA